MYNIEVNNRMNQLFGVFYRLGLWDKENETTVRRMGRRLFYFIFNMIFIWSLAGGAVKSDENDEAVYLAGLTVFAVVLKFKLFHLICIKKDILGFIHQIANHSVEDHGEFIQVNKKLKIFIRFLFSLIWMVLLGISVAMIAPLVSSEKKLPQSIWFPLDYKSSELVYWTAFVFCMCGMFVSAFGMLFNVVIWYIMYNYVIKYEVLGNRFRNLGVVSSQKPTTKKSKITEADKHNLFLRDLLAAIKTHRTIKESIERFKCRFSNVFGIQLATSSICICGSVYALVFINPNNLFQFALFAIILIYSFFDIFLYLYLGNEIQLSSDRLSYCVFESNWMEQPKSCRKCIVILMEFLKQPQILVIWKLYPLNLETFMRILHGAYSMFNILQNLK